MIEAHCVSCIDRFDIKNIFFELSSSKVTVVGVQHNNCLTGSTDRWEEVRLRVNDEDCHSHQSEHFESHSGVEKS